MQPTVPPVWCKGTATSRNRQWAMKHIHWLLSCFTILITWYLECRLYYVLHMLIQFRLVQRLLFHSIRVTV